MKRRDFIATGIAVATLPRLAHAQAIEKKSVKIAVGGKNLFYYLPLSIAERLGYFKEAGLDVEVVDFAGGSKALQAVVGGSADVVSGAFEHTLNMQFKGQPMRAFVVQGAAPQIVLGYNPRTMPDYKSVADLKGKKIGVTAPGSSTNVLANFVLDQVGLKPSDVSFVGVGASSGAVAAMQSGQIDAISNLDPVITLLQRSGDLKVITDTRDPAQAQKVFGGPMIGGVLYAPVSFLDKNPGTVQALTEAMVRANRWIQQATADDVVKVVPENYLLGDPAIYMDGFRSAQKALSPDGTFPEQAPDTALRALASIDEKIGKAKLDLQAVYTNEFARRANAKLPKS